MASTSGYRFMVVLLVLYLAATALFLLFIQHTSSRHLSRHRSAARSPLLVRRGESGGRPEVTAHLEQPPAKRRPLVLFWTPLWGRFDHWTRYFSVPRLGECRCRCSFTSQERRLREASLVLYSAADLHRMPPPAGPAGPDRAPGQLWALFSLDPPPAAGSEAARRLQLRRHHALFNWTVSYRRDADVPLTYGRTVKLTGPAPAGVPVPRGRRALFRPQQCRTASGRERYVAELQRHMPVDVLGPCGNGSCGAAAQCLAGAAANYTFYLALEAAHCPDLVSARLHQALRYGLIPVVGGGADYARLAPPGSYIDTARFAGPAALARHLTGLSDEQVRGLHRWRRTYRVLPADWACQLCTRLHRHAESATAAPAHSGHQLHAWWERGACRGDKLKT